MFADELARAGRAVVRRRDGRGGASGYGGVAVLADDDAHLMNLAVAPASRRAGLGRALLDALLDAARELGADGSRSRSARATRRDRALRVGGLRAVGVRPGYYGDTGEDAVIMWGEPAECAPTQARRVAGHARRRAHPRDRDRRATRRPPPSCAAGASCSSNVVASQIDFHARFGGVVPEIASRKHTEAIVGVVDEAMRARRRGARLTAADFAELDAIAVTHGPGLVGALVVGVAYAKGLAMATGHAARGREPPRGPHLRQRVRRPEVAPPLVALLVSGGHTSLVHMPEWGVYHTLGETLDDAAGEAFDKVAKVLGLGYPGGPVLSRLAEQGDPAAIDFPRAMMNSGDYAFSLSGLKTAVLDLHPPRAARPAARSTCPTWPRRSSRRSSTCRSPRRFAPSEETGATRSASAGGVAANPALREALTAAIEPLGVHVSVPPLELCTDNAAMIAAAAHYRFLRGDGSGSTPSRCPTSRFPDEHAVANGPESRDIRSS